MTVRHWLVTTVLVSVASLVVTGCATSSAEDEGRLDVLASFYPLAFVAEQVGGDLVSVDNLTPTASDPHNLELSPAMVRRVADADAVLYLSSFQPAVDDVLDSHALEVVVDAAQHIPLDSAHHDHDGHNEATTDPHFWLDPTLLARLATPVADALADADPANAGEYARGAATLEARLSEIDSDFSARLEVCDGATVVTSHAAFGYLADRYNLEQVSVTGIDPESDPSPARLRKVGSVIREHRVTTLFADARLSDKSLRTLASDLGTNVEVLDTLETLSSETAEAGGDYLSVMRENLDALVSGLVCAEPARDSLPTESRGGLQSSTTR